MAAGHGAAMPADALLRGCALPHRESRTLLCRILGISRERLAAHPETGVGPAERAQFAAAVAQRLAGTPLAYLVGEQEFYGRRFLVTPAVLVPRPETELLVDTALGILEKKPAARVLELGTGSGCIAITLRLARPDIFLAASDISPEALAVARANSVRLGAPVNLLAGDWFSPLRGAFDLIVSNPPYIAAQDTHLAALRFEPRGALTDGADGLDALRHIVSGAARFLAPGGTLLVEHGYDQGAAVRSLMRTGGLQTVESLRDLAGLERVCRGSVAEA